MSDATTTTQAAPAAANQLAPQQVRTVPITIIPPQQRFEPKSYTELERFADMAMKTGILGPTYKNPGYVLMVVMKGASLGLSCMESINWIYPIPSKAKDGQEGGCRLSYAAELIGARFIRAGGIYTWLETTEKVARVKLEIGGRSHEHRFTMGDAVLAGLDGKFNWKSYPAAMLRNRALTAGIRAFRPDISSGLYDPDELGAEVTATGQLIAGADGQPIVHAIEAPADAPVVHPDGAKKPKLSPEARQRVSNAAGDLSSLLASTVTDQAERAKLAARDPDCVKKIIADRRAKMFPGGLQSDADLEMLEREILDEVDFLRKSSADPSADAEGVA